VTRLGYGCADGKHRRRRREKEIIGDALRNAAMRFGAALDLWHKGDLHADEEGAPAPSDWRNGDLHLRKAAPRQGLFKEGWEKNKDGWKRAMDARLRPRRRRDEALAASFPADEPAPQPPPPADDFGLGDDEIPF
jgi:hypothetical protein